MKYQSEELDFVYATCDECKKVKKIPRKHLSRCYYGYKMEKLAQCSCGAVLAKIEGHDEESVCHYCGKEVSIHLDRCPYCGTEGPHQKPKEKLNFKRVLPWLAILLVIAGLLAAIFIGKWQNREIYITDEQGITRNGTIGLEREEEEKAPVKEKETEEETQVKEEPEVTVVKAELTLYDGAGNFLGQLVTNKEAADSIFNETGSYGSTTSATSIWNKASDYGAAKTSKSAFYEKASDPPQIFMNGEFFAYLSTNPYKKPRISPEKLWDWLSDQGY